MSPMASEEYAMVRTLQEALTKAEDRAHEAESRVESLTAENERLTKERDAASDYLHHKAQAAQSWMEEANRLRAEATRYREALERIEGVAKIQSSYYAHVITDIARTALSGDTPTSPKEAEDA